MIARVWRGVVDASDADEYADYIRATGFDAYGQTEGNLGAWLLRRDRDGRTEFVTYSLWESTEAIKAFAGEYHEVAVYYPDDERFLIERDDFVAHFEVIDRVGP